ncbi:Hypothetical protein (Fragment), partial [Durusdinium trenchii]
MPLQKLSDASRPAPNEASSTKVYRWIEFANKGEQITEFDESHFQLEGHFESNSSEGHKVFQDRLRAIHFRKEGRSKAEIAQLLGRSEQFVAKWWQKEEREIPRPWGVHEYMSKELGSKTATSGALLAADSATSTATWWRDVELRRRYACDPAIYEELLTNTEWKSSAARTRDFSTGASHVKYDKEGKMKLQGNQGPVQEDCNSLLQARAPVVQHTVVEQQEIVWKIAKDINYTLQIFSIVPTFGADGNYIALLHDFDPVLANYTDEYALYCSDASGLHKTQLRVYGKETGIRLSLILKCDWPEEQSELENFEVFLENDEGKVLGKVSVNHNKPSAKHQSVACVRDIFALQEASETLAYKHFVEWLEFHLYHGMDHFFVYTFGTVDDVYEEILKPYLLAGAATRIHFKTRPDFHRLRHYWSMTDCLYRSKNHATWVMPSVDQDEYFRVTGPSELFGDTSVPQNYFRTVWDAIVRHEGWR